MVGGRRSLQPKRTSLVTKLAVLMTIIFGLVFAVAVVLTLVLILQRGLSWETMLIALPAGIPALCMAVILLLRSAGVLREPDEWRDWREVPHPDSGSGSGMRGSL